MLSYAFRSLLNILNMRRLFGYYYTVIIFNYIDKPKKLLVCRKGTLNLMIGVLCVACTTQ